MRAPRVVSTTQKLEDSGPDKDTFVETLQTELENMLKRSDLEPKDRNALFSNAIKFLAVRNKLGGDDGGFWGDE